MRIMILGFLLSLFATSNWALAQGQRYFIGIGVNGYDHNKLTDLDFAENDIITTGRVFSEYGYRATILTTTVEPLVKPKLAKKQPNPKLVPTKANILAALKEVLNQCKKGDLVVVAVAGHGLYFAEDPDDYFCPVDARPFKEDKDTLISLNSLYQMLDRCGASSKVLLADCCRNDPDPSRSRSGETFLDKEPPRGVIALYACSKDQRAYENPELKHGIFFYHILEGLQGKVPAANDEVEFELLSRHVRINVPRTVKKLLKDDRTQVPEQKGTLQGNPLVLLSRTDSKIRKDWNEYQEIIDTYQDAEAWLQKKLAERGVEWKNACNTSPVAMVLYADALQANLITRVTLRKDILNLLLTSSRRGNCDAMRRLAECYHRGVYTNQDNREAVRWLKQAIASNDAEAMYMIVDISFSFIYTPGPISDDDGLDVGKISETEYKNKYGIDRFELNKQMLTKAADLGSRRAMQRLAWHYYHGTDYFQKITL